MKNRRSWTIFDDIENVGTIDERRLIEMNGIFQASLGQPSRAEYRVEMRAYPPDKRGVGHTHFLVKAGCNEKILHTKEEVLGWLGELWDQHVAEKPENTASGLTFYGVDPAKD